MAPKNITLVYFNGRGRAEQLRWILVQGGAKWDDKRIEQSVWPELKPKTPVGSLPYLEADGKQVGTSGAIAMYLGRELGLLGANILEAAKAHMFWECTQDTFNAKVKAMFAKSDDEKAKLFDEFFTQAVPKLLKLMASHLEGGRQWLVGDQMTIADLATVCLLEEFKDGPGLEAVKGQPLVDQLVKRVTELPKIKMWLENRPDQPEQSKMAPSQLKLVYFNLKGRAEQIRWILVQAGVKYEDKRIEPSDWPQLKPQTPVGSLPYLEADGKCIGTSLAVAMYLGREFNLAGCNSLEMAKVEMVWDMTQDVLNAYRHVANIADATQKAAETDKHFNQTVPNYVKFLEKELGGDDWLVGNNLTLADIVAACLFDLKPADKVLNDSPTVSALFHRVYNLPNIKAWIASRPETPY